MQLKRTLHRAEVLMMITSMRLKRYLPKLGLYLKCRHASIFLSVYSHKYLCEFPASSVMFGLMKKRLHWFNKTNERLGPAVTRSVFEHI